MPPLAKSFMCQPTATAPAGVSSAHKLAHTLRIRTFVQKTLLIQDGERVEEQQNGDAQVEKRHRRRVARSRRVPQQGHCCTHKPRRKRPFVPRETRARRGAQRRSIVRPRGDRLGRSAFCFDNEPKCARVHVDGADWEGSKLCGASLSPAALGSTVAHPADSRARDRNKVSPRARST